MDAVPVETPLNGFTTLPTLDTSGIRIRSVSRAFEARTGASLKPDDIDVHDGIAAARALAELGAVVTWDAPGSLQGHSFRSFRVAFAGCTVSGCAYEWEVEALLGGYLPDPWNLGLDCRTAVEQRARAALEASEVRVPEVYTRSPE